MSPQLNHLRALNFPTTSSESYTKCADTDQAVSGRLGDGGRIGVNDKAGIVVISNATETKVCTGVGREVSPIGIGYSRTGQIGLRQPSAAQGGAGQVGAGQVSDGQVSAGQVSVV
jgi:hypothetical protein